MNWKQLLLAGALAASTVDAFAPSQPAAWVRAPRGAARQLPVRHLVESKGSDGFAVVKERATAGGKAMSGLPAPAVNAALNSLPAAAALGAAALLPVPMPLKALGAYGAALLGNKGRRALVPKRDAACLFDLATLLDSQDYATVSPSVVDDLQRKHAVPTDVFVDMKADVFTEFFLALLKSPEFKSAEVKELTALMEVLSLSPADVGNALVAATEQTYTKQMMWTSSKDLEDPDSLERMTVDKCIFLVARLTANHDTAEGAAYTRGRCSKLLQLSQEDWVERQLAMATPLYEKALATVMTKLDKVTPENVAKAQAALGLTLTDVSELHEDLYSEEVYNLLVAEEDPVKLTVAAKERLAKLQHVLGLSEKVAQDITTEQVLPVFELDITDIMTELLTDLDNTGTAVGQLAVRSADLSLQQEQSEAILVKVLKDLLAAPLEEAVQFIKIDNTRAALQAMHAVIERKETAASILDAMAESNMVSEDAVDNFFQSALPPVKASIAEALYKVLLKDTMAAANDALSDSVAELEEMMGINAVASARIFSEVCGPLLAQSLSAALEAADFSEAAAAAFQSQVKAQRIPAEVYAKAANAAYQKELEKATQPAGKIITQAERESLDAVRAFLCVESEAAYAMHLKACGPAFEQSVGEAMAAGSGIITAEYREGLDKLAARFMLRDAEKDQVFNKALLVKLKPMAAKLIATFEEAVLTKEQLAQRRGQDQGEDLNTDGSGGNLGLNSGSDLLTEVGNLVDFFEGNGLWSVKEGSENAEKPEYEYKVTARGLAEDKMFEELFRQASVMQFQAAGGGGAVSPRTKQAQTHLAGMLGLSAAKKTEILNGIGSIVYSNFVGDLLQKKGEVETSDMQQLVSIQETLGLEADTALTMLWNLKKRHTQKAVDKVLSGSMKDLQADAVAKLRAVADKVGVDLVDDLKLDGPTKIQFFLAEVSGVIEQATDVDAAKAAIGDLQETWELSVDNAEAQFESLVAKKVQGAGAAAAAALAGQRDKQCLSALQELVAYAPFGAGEAAPTVEVESNRVANDLVKLFVASVKPYGDDEEMPEGAQEKVDLLKAIFQVE